jgi:hypothetical protein
MNVTWMINTNTFLLVFLIVMVLYLVNQVNAIIRFLRRE